MKKKITIIDVLIVLIIIAAGFVVARVMSPSGAEPDGEVEFVVLASEVDADAADGIKKGDTAILSQTQKTTVIVSDVFTEPSKVSVFDNETKTFKQQKSKQKKDVYVTVKTDAKISDTAIIKDDVFIRVGAEASIDSKNLSVKGHIVEIKSEGKN